MPTDIFEGTKMPESETVIMFEGPDMPKPETFINFKGTGMPTLENHNFQGKEDAQTLKYS